MSAPAQKFLPAPVMTTARTLGVDSSFLSVAVSASTISASKALCTSGRFSITVALPSASIWESIFWLMVWGRFKRRTLSHAENAEARLLDWRGEARRDSERQGVARLPGIDDAVVPQPGGGVVGARLARVLLHDRRLECILLLPAPLLAALLERFALHLREHAGSLLAAHDRDPGVGPRPQEPRRVRAPAHAVVAGAEAAADDERELGHACACDRRHHLGAVLGDAPVLGFLPHHEAGDVLEEHERDAAPAGELDEMRALQRRLGEQDA